MTTPFQIRRLIPALMCALALPVGAQPDLSLVDYQLASQKRISATVFEYRYRVNVHNAGTAADNVEVTLLKLPDGVTAVQRVATIPSLAAGATGSSGPDIIVRHDRSKPFPPNALGWALRGRDATFTGRLAGAPNSAALAATSNYVAEPGPRNFVNDSDGRVIDLTRIDVVFATDATIAQVNAALDAVGGRISSMGRGQRSLSVVIPDVGSIAALDALLNTLNAMPGVSMAWPSFDLQLLSLPNNPPYLNPTLREFYEDTVLVVGGKVVTTKAFSKYIDHHLAIRAHAAWNLKGLLEKPELKARRPVMIYWDEFGPQPPDMESNLLGNAWNPVSDTNKLWNVDIVPGDFGTLRYKAPQTHGYEVMSVVSGSFGGNNSESGLITGLYPAQLQSRVIDLVRYSNTEAIQKLTDLIAGFTTEQVNPDLRRNVIVNSSTGHCSQYEGERCLAVQRFEAARSAWDYINAVRFRLLDAEGRPTFLHIYATGNQPLNWAYYDKWGAADRFLELQDPADDPAVTLFHPYGQPGGKLASVSCKPTELCPHTVALTLDELKNDTDGAGQPLVQDKLTNMLGVEARLNKPTSLENFPAYPDLQIPASTRQTPPMPNCPASFSTTHGSIAGMGNDVAVLAGAAGPIYKGSDGAFANGTSFAAPQVAAVAAWIWSLAPQLNAEDVRRLIAATVAPNGVVCPFENSNAWPVDVYAAALATDNPYESGSPQYKDLGSTTDAPARLWLLDVASVDASGNLVDVPDGKFTQADIAKFLQEFEKRHGDQTPDYSRYDLNGNSVTGEPTKRADYVNVSRFDLDGNLTWTSANKEIEGNAQQFREEMTTDLEVLVYYAYSPLYTGNEYERTMLLLPYFHLLPSPAGLFLRELDINVPLRGTTFQIDAINALGDTFTSLCGVGGERGYPLYSEFVKSQSESGAFNSTGSKLYFWRPTQQFGRIQEKPTNVDNCSSFVAALPGTGLVWINSAARNLDPETNKDEEYQTRFFLGLPDLAAPADGSFKPTPRRVATQTLDYGIVSDAAGPFVQAFATQQLSLIRTGLTP